MLMTFHRLSEPFKVCRTRLGSRDRFYDYDEEDLTWVEYQWLSRTNDLSPRMVSWRNARTRPFFFFSLRRPEACVCPRGGPIQPPFLLMRSENGEVF